MAAKMLTATKIDKHKPSTSDERLVDGNGLYIRFRKRKTGQLSRTWMYTYKSGTKSIYLTLGKHDSVMSEFASVIYQLSPGSRLTLENARKIAVELTDLRRRGLDPEAFFLTEINRLAAVAEAETREELLRKKQIEIENLTFRDLFDAWLLDGVRRKDGNAELQRSFGADVLPKLGGKPIKHMTEHDFRAILRAMVARGVNRAATVMRNNLTQMFAWAEKRQPWRRLLVDGNPMSLIEIGRIVSPDYNLNNQRDRVLSAEEIHELHVSFERMQTEYVQAPDRRVAAQPVERTVQIAVWIILSTLCRVGELSMARWEHINLDTGEWFIPRENVKGKLNDFTVYLSAFALQNFRNLYQLTGALEWCFPSRNRGGHVCVKSMSKQIGDRQAMFKKSKDGEPRQPLKHRRHDNTLVLSRGTKGTWTPHDLRRTGATMMQSLGVPLDIIDRCQNHVLAGSKVRRHYLHHDYAREKREAWQQLGARLQSTIDAPDNVLRFQRMTHA